MLLLVTFISFIFTISECFLTEEDYEKIGMQFMGVVNFAMQTEEVRPIYRDVSFYLYTQSNPEEPQKLELYTPSFDASNFNFKLPSIFVIHGYTDHKDRKIIAALRRAFVYNLPANVIVVDWGRLAGHIYFNAAQYSLRVGDYLGDFLRFLEGLGYDLSLVHLVGHSLGAQISGIGGRIVNGKVGRITGLDPAAPLFEYVLIRNTTQCLDKTDANFVDVIHTASKIFGVFEAVGHADFYPNGGFVPMPGCGNILTSVSCSHNRAIEYLIESVNGTIKFLSKKCSILGPEGPKDCSNDLLVPMGYHLPKETRGIFYVQTNEDPPYALGGKFYKKLF